MDLETEERFKEFLAAQAREQKERDFTGAVSAAVVIVLVVIVWRLVAHGIL